MKEQTTAYHNLEIDEVLSILKTSSSGLTPAAARRRLRQTGRNTIKEKPGLPLWLLFLAQFRELLIIILLLGGIISFIIGNFRDGSIIFFIVLVNAGIGFHHEQKAGRIVARLKTLIRSPARVLRGDNLIEISQEELVPGDIIRLEAGDKVPADIRLIEVHDCRTSDFTLTGESLPQEKQIAAVAGDQALGDRSNMAFAGTIVAAGSALGVVTATGEATETGKIARLSQDTDLAITPLQIELRRLAHQLTAGVISIGVALFVIGILQNFSVYMSLVYSLGVAMAMVPQALPAQVSVALAAGSNQLSERNAVVKSLPAVETLGATTVICTDKTGTLTKNEMSVQSCWFNNTDYKVNGTGYEPTGSLEREDGQRIEKEELQAMAQLCRTATLASTASIHEPDHEHRFWYPIGDPTEAALFTMSAKLGFENLEEKRVFPELKAFAFDSELMRMSSLRRFAENDCRLLVKGSTASLLEISTQLYEQGKDQVLDQAGRERIMAINEKYAGKGMRVLALAWRRFSPEATDLPRDQLEQELTFLGLVAMIDPAREGVKEAVNEARAAHLRVFILTGDHPETARALGRAIGLEDSGNRIPVISGKEFRAMNSAPLQELLCRQQVLIFARVDPEDKLRIVEMLEELGEIVAVTGDGVNDAPALSKAHIGVAMGQRGNDVAKEAARLVLLDDNFATLVHAIRSGRRIYDNLRKTVQASLTTNIAELVLVLIGLAAAAIADYPIPILAGQILAIDLVGELGPLTLLTLDPAADDVMTRPPRRPDAHLISPGTGIRIVLLGTIIGALAFSNYLLFVSRQQPLANFDSSNNSYAAATAISYATIVFCQFINILEHRFPNQSLFNSNFFSNRLLLYATLVSAGLVMGLIYVPWLRDFLGFGWISLLDWLHILTAAALYLIFFEILKLSMRRRATPAVSTT